MSLLREQIDKLPDDLGSKVMRLGKAGRRVLNKIGPTFGIHEQHWCRVVMDRETESLILGLAVSARDCLEISGRKWESAGFRSYTSANYPEYDVCHAPYPGSGFDVVIAEQVLEHVLWPYRAVGNVYRSLRPGGVFMVTTPFMLRVHNVPVDCSRWTELGLKHLLAEGGFPLENIHTGSWGNQSCVKSNLGSWSRWISWYHSLRNERDYPVVVWAFARKPIDA